jgi:hypothetical protein
MAANINKTTKSSDERWDGNVFRLANCGVGQNQRLDGQVPCCANGDRATPVMGSQVQRCGHYLTAERHKLFNAFSELTWFSALGIPHAALVNGDDPPLWG